MDDDLLWILLLLFVPVLLGAKLILPGKAEQEEDDAPR